jgi:hypothetical protein
MPNTSTRILASLALAAPVLAQAKIQIPQASPAASVGYTIGITPIAIEYHRPAVKGREIWGGLVPYGQVWRTGANDATTIRFGDPVKIDGRDVPAGTYSFFAIPAKESWTLILNKTAKQWGAYDYDEKQDLMRWTVTPKAAPMEEWMSYAIEPLDKDSAAVHLRWEKLDVPFTVTIDVREMMLARIDKALAQAKADDGAVWLQAARYYYDIDYKTDRALEMVDTSLKIKEDFRALDLKARLLHKQKQDAQAIPLLERAMELAKGKAPQGYIDGLAKLVAEYKKG